MLDYCCSHRSTPREDPNHIEVRATQVTNTPASALLRLWSIEFELWDNDDKPPFHLPGSPTHPTNASRTEAELDEEDQQIVTAELSAYIANMVLRKGETTEQILSYWMDNQVHFPLLASIALDVLPVQASSIPCERVFTSNKETTTMHCANLSPSLMSALQELKFQYKQDWLNFVSHLTAKCKDFEADKITPEVVNELLQQGRLDELEDLLQTGRMPE
ncbi:hypothetical protein FRB93_011038 [Tulasnella sp. JGI-2019a]|nr:hypothetical protein FRB93_011038 [Tulasnella sp. JGI-2019a]